MTVEKRFIGNVEAVLAPATALKTVPKIPKSKAPTAAPYGEHGLVVKMVPVPGLTPKGIFTNEQPFTFQVPPLDSFGEEGDHPFDDWQPLGLGQQTFKAPGPSLRTVSYSTMFLDWQPVWSVLAKPDWTPNPQAFVRQLAKIRSSGQPFHLLVYSSSTPNAKYEVDYAATLRQFHWELRAGEDDAYYVTVSFVEHRAPGVEEFLSGAAQHPALPAKLTIRTLPPERATLSNLARFYYGDPSKWKVIAAANGLSKLVPSARLTPGNTGRATITVPKLKVAKKPARGQTRTERIN